jgi:hypothetical protein
MTSACQTASSYVECPSITSRRIADASCSIADVRYVIADPTTEAFMIGDDGELERIRVELMASCVPVPPCTRRVRIEVQKKF